MDLFWSKVDKSGECWIWKGLTDKYGYGRYSQLQAHHVSYLLHHGRIEEGKEIHHTCNNPPCVNPDHLQQVTHAQNIYYAMQDGFSGGRPTTLSKDEVKAIRYCYEEENYTQANIARLFDTLPSTIHSVVHYTRGYEI